MQFFLFSFVMFFVVLNWKVWQGKRVFGWESLLFPFVGAAFLALLKSFFRVYVLYQFLLLFLFVGIAAVIYYYYRKKFSKGQ